MPESPSTSTQVAWSSEDLRSNPHEMPDKARRVRSMFAAIAGSYDLNNRVHSLWRDQAWRRKAVRLCEVKASDAVLDVACGTGDLTQAFARAGAASVIGLDFTEEMLQIARRKAGQREDASDSASLKYVQGDAMNLPFGDAVFDVVSIAFGIRNVSDPAIALREFCRVLKPGGRLVVLEFSRPRNPIIRVFNSMYCERIMPITATLLARDRSGAYRYLPQSVATFYSPDDFVKLLAACGFANTTVHPMTFGICTAYLAHANP